MSYTLRITGSFAILREKRSRSLKIAGVYCSRVSDPQKIKTHRKVATPTSKIPKHNINDALLSFYPSKSHYVRCLAGLGGLVALLKEKQRLQR